MTAPTTAAAGDVVPAGRTASGWVGRLPSVLWTQLPTLVVGSVAVCAVAAPVLLFAPGLTPVSLVLWALVVAPVFSALVAQSHDMVLDRAPGPSSLLQYLRRTARLGVAAWLPPAVTSGCTLVALHVWRQTGSPLALAPAAVGAVVSALLTLAAITAVPLGLEDPDVRGVRLGLTGLRVVAHRPVPVFAVAGLLIAAVSAAVHLTASVLFLVPGPLALVAVVGVWTAADACGVHPQETER